MSNIIEQKAHFFGITHEQLSEKEVENWRLCKDGIHLFDEVLSDKAHYLICDACGFEIHIAKIITY